MKTKPPLLAALAFVALLGLTSCASDRVTTATPADGIDDPLAAVEPTTSEELLMRDIAFSSVELTARVGDVLELTLRNTGLLDHDFTIDELTGEVSALGRSRADRFAVHVPLDRKEEGLLRLRLTQRGEYVFYCSVPGHRSAGMEGLLIVR